MPAAHAINCNESLSALSVKNPADRPQPTIFQVNFGVLYEFGGAARAVQGGPERG